jgi:protein tyrosine phosphatase (PTP) superfamily phosphohydrolase (DUF442 family)
MSRFARLSLAALAVALAPLLAKGEPWANPPPNLVPATANIHTSGQPSAESLRELKAQGYEAVVYLAPPTVPDAVRDEARIVGGQGLVFVNVPIVFDSPTARDVDTFFAVMKALGERKVLVHCQVNLRASSMVFLYRAIVAREDPDEAWKAVEKVWTPRGPWKRLIEEQLGRHGVAFEIF